MTPLDAAKALAGQSEPVSPIGYGSTRVLCRTKLGEPHASDCPWPHLSAIVTALEIVGEMLAELGEHPVADPETGFWRGFAHSHHDTCLLCGVSSFMRSPHDDTCRWPELVVLLKGEAIP